MEKGESSEGGEKLIPGPAGKIQKAIRRKMSKDPASFNESGEQLSTQQFINKVNQEPPAEDIDFIFGPWIMAIEYIKRNGYMIKDGTCIGTSLAEIHMGNKWRKIPQVVAIISVCNPNGLGDAMLTLKDPTGTMSANLHRKVYTETLFGNDIRVGNVIILQNVTVTSVFKASNCCLNIIAKNILNVITNETTMDDILNCAVVPDSDVE